MPKRAKGLTARGVATLRDPGMHADGGGLYLRIAPTGARSWIFRYQIAGRRRDMGLGPVDVFSLADARQRAAEARRQVAEGQDPLAQRQASRAATRAALTFAEASGQYIKAHGPSWRNEKHRAQWSATLETYAHPVIGQTPIGMVDLPAVLAILEPIWTEKPETAGRVRGRIEKVLDWAKARGLREGENPARWRGNLDALLPARRKVRRVRHHAALPYSDLPAFWRTLTAAPGTAAAALRFLILTAARTGEVIGAEWSEFDLEAAVWTVPAERMKGGRPHRVPLSPAAVALLEGLAEPEARSGYVFAGGKPGKPLSNMAILATLRRLGRGDVTAHGFRSTFRDWAAEMTAYPAEVAEMALAHAIGSDVEAAYRRGDLFDKRRRLMGDWAAFATGPTPAGAVVPLRQGA